MQPHNESSNNNKANYDKSNRNGSYYYDLHTHIIPGVDDGSDSLEESLEMIRQMREQGVLNIVATPHYPDGRSEKINDAFILLKEKVNELYPDMKLYLGNELLNGPGIIDALKNKNALTIADTKYILVEFLPGDSAKKIYAALREYIMEGYIPIVAHIERYEKLYKNYDFLDELINMGVYIQMNTESIVGGLFDRHAAYCRKLLMNGYVHFLGSDCHGANRRKPLMKDAIEKLKLEFVNSSLAEKILFENPIKMLEGKYI